MLEFNSMRLRLGINFIFFDFPSLPNDEDDEYTKSARNEHTKHYTDTPFFNVSPQKPTHRM